ncbi:uncharacterized protein LOC114274944 [Camellia sinensis]|uniref:uncharacterized protein LOC114274944 n=1 Tax=Camellia sinensis TaxID=4442 RepID=UPI0010367552|nr:uncharacterized protein LOC114274944 [Camellia sinensis]
MRKDAFATLVSMLKRTQFLRDNPQSKVEEQVAKFLYIIGNNFRNHTIRFFYRQSGETVSWHFHQVLKAIISLEDIFLKQPDGFKCPPEIRNNPKYWHYFKFKYILPGWERSASDSRILDNALTRKMDKLIVPQGKYYLVDVGFQLKTGFLVPYRSTRYHLKEYSVHQPENSQELFNLCHASLRNEIERAFGVLKKRFPILGSGAEPYYDVDTQADIVLACCILHNYLMGIDPNEGLVEEVDTELRKGQVQANVARSSLAEECREGELLRKRIATDMWRDYDINL